MPQISLAGYVFAGINIAAGIYFLFLLYVYKSPSKYANAATKDLLFRFRSGDDTALDEFNQQQIADGLPTLTNADAANLADRVLTRKEKKEAEKILARRNAEDRKRNEDPATL